MSRLLIVREMLFLNYEIEPIAIIEALNDSMSDPSTFVVYILMPLLSFLSFQSCCDESCDMQKTTMVIVANYLNLKLFINNF